MRILNSILAIMFMVFAFVQVNDPDPILWILVYGAMAAICVMAIFEFYVPKIMWALAVGYILYAAILFPGVLQWFNSEDRFMIFSEIAKMQNQYIEEAREFLGLMICLLVLALYFFLSRKTKSVG